ncbi:MAG TPA: DUF3368 domain-containing protein [Blastocatellia bacterium]|nr:DUF3368 domain-containing protein [Blastocatellia bacterium]HMX28058.1 DUF3368 domain-containing protein [Blastocatellia bacterium]HMY71273.1 DUF3368 domain-containing protein [Blastocatellia bacterium]HMZ17988.1 DUF3368 domain-containing protein [Blastocatellia bacterium]HNG31515.1 DUF3368 domain-containing protein [Blastocatellia bacterium]
MIVSNTTPLNYLILIECVEILPSLYGEVVIPEAVFLELQHYKTPVVVREWIKKPPPWLIIRQLAEKPDEALQQLQIGEAQAIALAGELAAKAIIPKAVILDDRAAREEAIRRGMTVFGTLRVIYEGALAELCDLPAAFERLRQTNFRASAVLFNHFQKLNEQRQKAST